MKKGIIGNGGFGREVFYTMTKEEQLNTVKMWILYFI